VSWVVKKLGDLLKIQNGYAFDSKLFSTDGEMPLIRIRDIKKGVETETRYTGEYDSKYIVKKGDLLIGMDGEFGCYEWKGGDALLNQRVCRLQNFENQIYPRFLLYGINSYLKAIEDVTGYTTVKHLSSKQIANIEFPLPPLATQQKIVAKLDAIFDEIDKATAVAEANAKNVDAFLSQFLTNIEDHYDGTVKELGDCVELLSGFAFKSDEYTSNANDIPLLRGDNLNPKYVDLSDARRFDRSRYDEYLKFSLAVNDIVIGMDRPIISSGLRIAKIQTKDVPSLLVQRVMRLRCYDKIDSDFLFYLLNSTKFINHLAGGQTGLGVPHISGKTIACYQIKVPTIEIQKNFVLKLNSISERLNSYKVANLKIHSNWNSFKQSILKQAFAGELVQE
jgi:type I restriction enzyme, S subunit